jgi:hypothetical protein
MSKRVFFISSSRLRAYHYDGQLAEPLEFRADEEGLTAFSLYLEQPWRTPVYVLVDFVEEEFREELVPHVFGTDRRAMLRTKLNRLFRDATYAHSVFQGRTTEGRRDDRMLFTALIRPDLLAPWMGQLTKHKTPVAGVYSLPLVSKELLKLLKLESGNLLLVTLQSSGGLRQTYFKDGALKVSRLAMLPDPGPEAFTASMLGEVERVRRYLNSLRMLPGKEALDVYVLANERVRVEVERHSPTSITARHQVVTLAEAASRLGIRGQYDGRFADRLFAHLLASRAPANQYAPEAQTRYFRLHQVRRGLVAASVFLLIGSLAWSAAKFVDGLSAIQDVASARKQAAFYETRYEEARARLPATPTDSRNMKRVVEAVGELDGYRTDPQPVLQVLSIGLEAFPQVRLDQLRWRIATDPGATVEEAASAGRGRGAQRGRREDFALFQIAVVKAHIAPFSGNYREALATVRRFAERLRTIPGVENVQVESMPLDIGPEASLSGDVRRSGGDFDASFELRVAVRSAGGSA